MTNNYLSKAARNLGKHNQPNEHPTNHPVAKGDHRERKWHNLFGGTLPKRFKVDKGFVCDSKGELSQQTDLIVYLRNHTMLIPSGDEGTDIIIPVESVLAVFEIKPSINKETLDYAQDKANSVTQLTVSNVKSEKEDVEMLANNIITGILADRIASPKGWESVAFKEFLGRASLSMFMTLDSGCVDLLEYGYPADGYRCYDKEDALIHALFALIETLHKFEESRRYQLRDFRSYRNLISSPRMIKMK